VWILICAFVVAMKLYESWSDLGFLLFGLVVCLPCILWPIFFPSKADRHIPWTKRYATKANLWVALFNFVGNYFWTHYFFALLGASYTFPLKFTFNKIPPVCFLLTQAYFHTYYVFSNLLLRRIHHSIRPPWLRILMKILCVFAFSMFVSFMEAWTLESFPYYTFTDRKRFYQIGIAFYALYFFVSFPMFFRLDEERGESWTLFRTACESLASAMVVFILCDFWRLTIGNILADVPYERMPFIY
jgi:cycloeucalenol cycloisomerase